MATLGFILKSGPYTSARGENLCELASAALGKGHQVIIYLDLDGVYHAIKTQKSLESLVLPKDKFTDLIQKGALIYLCGVCLNSRGLDEPGLLIDGTKKGNTENLAEIFGDADKLVTL